MRRLARGVVAGLLLLIAAPAAAHAADFTRALRDLDGAQFLEDEPIWICDAGAAPPGTSDAVPHGVRIRGVTETGALVQSQSIAHTFSEPPARAGDLVRNVWFDARTDLHPLESGDWGGGGLRAGRYEVVAYNGRVLASFRVVEPRGSEESVRAGLARAARLSLRDEPGDAERAAMLYEAVLKRYPNTSYTSVIWAGLWRVRAHSTVYAREPGAWLEAVFAGFHNTCFGVWALDRFVADVPAEEARPIVRKLVGLYPDTRVARASLVP